MVEPISEYRKVIDGVLAAGRAERIASVVMDVTRFADTQPVSIRHDAIATLLAWDGESVNDLAVPPIDEEQGARLSVARVRAMELGLSPWPSASGWAPMDLPWKERRILIGIVEGIASLARVQECSGCGERMCGHMNESVCPLCGEHVCGDHFDDSPPVSELAPTVGADS